MNLIIMILLLSVLILIHELGHFLVAKAFGIKVDRFGFGLPFGPTLFEKKIGDTIICLHPLLLGGYVSFPDDDPESELPKEHPDRISNRPIWQRFLVVSAGVISNAVLAYLIVLLVGFSLNSLPSGKYDIFIAEVNKDMPAAAFDFKKDDKIYSINGLVLSNPAEFIEVIKRSKTDDNLVSPDMVVNVMENIKKSNPSLKLTPSSILKQGDKILLPAKMTEERIEIKADFYLKPYKPSGVKLDADLQKLRDELKENTYYEIKEEIPLYEFATAYADGSHPINIEVLRGKEKILFKNIYPNKEGLIGVGLSMKEQFTPINGMKSMIKVSWNYLYDNTYMMVDGLIKLFTGKVAFENVHGIVAITKVGSDIIEHRGIWNGLLLTALISMNLAIINLLPIPALDGGHILFLMISAITGKPVSEEFQENISKVFFLLLIVFMIVIIFNDIFALVTNKI